MSKIFSLSVIEQTRIAHVLLNDVHIDNELKKYPDYVLKLKKVARNGIINNCEHTVVDLYDDQDKRWLNYLCDFGYELAVVWFVVADLFQFDRNKSRWENFPHPSLWNVVHL